MAFHGNNGINIKWIVCEDCPPDTMYVIAGEKLEKYDAVGFPDKKGRVKKIKNKN